MVLVAGLVVARACACDVKAGKERSRRLMEAHGLRARKTRIAISSRARTSIGKAGLGRQRNGSAEVATGEERKGIVRLDLFTAGVLNVRKSTGRYAFNIGLGSGVCLDRRKITACRGVDSGTSGSRFDPMFQANLRENQKARFDDHENQSDEERGQ